MEERVRIRFESTHAVNRIPISVTLPDKKDEPPTVTTGDGQFYQLRSAGLRGGLRHWALYECLWRMPKGTQLDTRSYQLNDKGGIKGSDRAPALSASMLDEIARVNPQLGLFGAGDPFIKGTLAPQHMVSVQPVTSPPQTQDIVRRPIDISRLPVTISDPEYLEEYYRSNRKRSRLAMAFDRLQPLQRIRDRDHGKLDERGQKTYDTVLQELSEEFGQEFKSQKDVKEALDKLLETMSELGMPDNSEQMIQRFHFIPARTDMSHRMDLIFATRHGAGLVVAAFDNQWRTNPYIGGRFAAGCGGLLELRYDVAVLDGSTWRKDCVLSVMPDDGIAFEHAERSLLRQCYNEWKEADISQFDFTYDRVRAITGSNGKTVAAAEPTSEEAEVEVIGKPAPRKNGRKRST